jgi:hypothetical protein
VRDSPDNGERGTDRKRPLSLEQAGPAVRIHSAPPTSHCEHLIASMAHENLAARAGDAVETPQFIGKPKTRATLSCTILRVSPSGMLAKFCATFLRE